MRVLHEYFKHNCRFFVITLCEANSYIPIQRGARKTIKSLLIEPDAAKILAKFAFVAWSHRFQSLYLPIR